MSFLRAQLLKKASCDLCEFVLLNAWFSAHTAYVFVAFFKIVLFKHSVDVNQCSRVTCTMKRIGCWHMLAFGFWRVLELQLIRRLFTRHQSNAMLRWIYFYFSVKPGRKTCVCFPSYFWSCWHPVFGLQKFMRILIWNILVRGNPLSCLEIFNSVVLNLSTHSYPLSFHKILSYPLSEGK